MSVADAAAGKASARTRIRTCVRARRKAPNRSDDRARQNRLRMAVAERDDALHPPADGTGVPTRTSPRIGRPDPRGVTAAGWLGIGLGAALVYAAFADGAIALPMEARLQVGVAALALLAFGALLFGRGVRASSTTAGWTGLALLVVFSACSGLSSPWSLG